MESNYYKATDDIKINVVASRQKYDELDYNTSQSSIIPKNSVFKLDDLKERIQENRLAGIGEINSIATNLEENWKQHAIEITKENYLESRMHELLNEKYQIEQVHQNAKIWKMMDQLYQGDSKEIETFCKQEGLDDLMEDPHNHYLTLYRASLIEKIDKPESLQKFNELYQQFNEELYDIYQNSIVDNGQEYEAYRNQILRNLKEVEAQLTPHTILRTQLSNMYQYLQSKPEVTQAKMKLESLFGDNSFTNEEKLNYAYYKIDSKTYYPISGNGLSITIGKGGDTHGTEFKDSETLIEVSSPLSHTSYTSLYTFWNQEFEISEDELKTFVVEGSPSIEELQEILKNESPLIYNTLSENYKNDLDVIDTVVNKLYQSASKQFEFEKRNAEISPYDGLDVNEKPAPYHFIESLKDYANANPLLQEEAKKFLMNTAEGREYIDNYLDECSMKLYFIEHKEAYDFLNSDEVENLINEQSDYKFELEGLEREAHKLCLTKNKIEKNIDVLKGKKFKFYQFNKRNQTKKEIEKLEKDLDCTELELDENTMKQETCVASMKASEAPLKELNEKVENLNLKYPYYKDFVLGKIFDPTDDMYGYEKSMQVLCASEDNIRKQEATIKALKTYTPFQKIMRINVQVFKEDIKENEKVLEQLNKNLEKVLENPKVYDVRIDFKINNHSYLTNKVITDESLKSLSPMIINGDKKTVFELAKALIPKESDKELNEINKVEESLNQNEEYKEINVQVETTLSPSM